MEGTIINNVSEPCTCCKDVVKLLEFKGDSTDRDFTLYETSQIDLNRKEYEKVYFILIKDDFFDDIFPIIITQDTAMEILKNPYLGERLAYNRWFDRYR